MTKKIGDLNLNSSYSSNLNFSTSQRASATGGAAGALQPPGGPPVWMSREDRINGDRINGL